LKFYKSFLNSKDKKATRKKQEDDKLKEQKPFNP